MPCYNDGSSIEKAIQSIRDQDLPDIEMVVVNDGSTDDSKTVIDALKEQGLIDKVIHLEKNSGACVARNEGTKIAEGKYVSFLPADAILYPGMARIWYETLEEHPDYDFLYGGYRMIDENDEPLPGNDFFFEPFDPYLLEVTNYIDGSFPIRREAFWKYAKLMNQPDGLWDPNIKSLQDWDFWLSVVKNGGKGLYVQDIFFGTTMPHKGGLSDDSANNWIERTTAIKKKHNIPVRKMCVTSLGAGFHAKRIAYMLGADFKQMPSFKPHEYDAIYSIGFYPQFGAQQDAIFLNNIYDAKQGRTAAKKIVHFVGTDIWELYHAPLIHLKNVWVPYFRNAVDVVLCEDDFTRLELQELGIEAKVVPLPPIKLFDVRPLPKEFTVACYLPAVNRDFYRPNEMFEIAKRLPDVKFKIFGNAAQVGKDPALSQNIEYVGYISDMDSFISECTAIMRFPVHDGLPISVLEFLLAGRYSVQSTPVTHTLCVPQFTVDAAVSGIQQLQEDAKQGVNQIASDFWRERLNHETFVKTITDLAFYKPKEYWENRAGDWIEQANFKKAGEANEAFKKNFEFDVEEIKKVFEEVKPSSVIDIGCGDGRFVPYMTDWGVTSYYGMDISDNLIKMAKDRFPHLKGSFETSRIEDFVSTRSDIQKYDVAFTYTCLEHVKEEDIQSAVDSIKKIAKKAIIVEPTNFTSRYYCINHDYQKLFNVEKVIELKDKKIFICNLE